MKKLIKTLIFMLLMGMPIAYALPRQTPKKNKAKVAHKNAPASQSITFERCADEELYKKLLENEKLIRRVLSKYPEIKAVTIKATTEDVCGASMLGISLSARWFKDADDMKEFVLAHEAAHIVCGHTTRPLKKLKKATKELEATLEKIKKGERLDPKGLGPKNNYYKKFKKYAKDSEALTLLLHGTACLGMVSVIPVCEYVGFALHKAWLVPVSSFVVGTAGLSFIYKSLEKSRQKEKEADLMAVERLGTAEGGIKYFEQSNYMIINLIKKTGCYSTHPSDGERVAYLKEWQAKHKK